MFDKASASLRARKSRRLGAVVLNEQTARCRPATKRRRAWPKASRQPASASLLEQGTRAMARPRDVPAAGRR